MPTPAPTATPTPALTASWPVYHQNPGRTGQSADTPAVATLATEWNATLDGAVWAQPIVVGGNVIVGRTMWARRCPSPTSSAAGTSSRSA
jgi:hypothetical protein